ncbi:hypothetical protein TIFTF001_024703 [Ficus carica]|uniref:Uncharacterized protein n=1 Tax=Ficus carica TaxID=3494 RepID=A0AA88AMH1_FICCA|nr:hypothetical protein TIFTF001_024703 [Ficus carica]
MGEVKLISAIRSRNCFRIEWALKYSNAPESGVATVPSETRCATSLPCTSR